MVMQIRTGRLEDWERGLGQLRDFRYSCYAKRWGQSLDPFQKRFAVRGSIPVRPIDDPILMAQLLAQFFHALLGDQFLKITHLLQ
jgi:hypothetical protein